MSMYGSIVMGFMDAMNPDAAKRRREQHREWCTKQLVNAEPWSPEKTKFKKVLVIKADTYKPRSLFLVRPHKSANINDATDKQLVISPDKKWCYAEKICPKAYDIPIAFGRDRGIVIFDEDVIIPALFEADPHGGERWNTSPWMSLTPMESLTLRPGTVRAKGTVIVAGLGLGHQLIEVSKRRQVAKIVLVERDEGLVHWLLPKIKPFMWQGSYPRFEVVIGDAYKVMPKMKADVALVDIFPSFGGNEGRRDELRRTCPNIEFVWGWGCNAWRE